ncbi:hypothetical protein, partial [Klebsiella pneumoniae]|uniref:hypothetical protein n=1 Tax=Klebsiella pneumoniae TaxID=573 RepID=UPI0040556FBB
LEPAYEGPFKVIARSEKYFTIQLKSKDANISIDRLKPAYILASPEESGLPSPELSSIGSLRIG